MKEIKFRAWHREVKKYYEVEAIDFMTEEIMYIYGDYYHEEQTKEWFHFDDIILEQYTGMKDKNGVNIYEGDIVCMHNFYGGFDDKIDVIGIVGINEMGTYTETEDDKLFWLNYWIEPEEELEVIGNIYEHPELLKEREYE